MITVLHLLLNFVTGETGAEASKAKLYRFISAASQLLHQNLLPSKVLYKLLKRVIHLNVEIAFPRPECCGKTSRTFGP